MHRLARAIAIAGLGLGALVLLAFVAWSLYTRATFDPTEEGHHSAIARGFQILAFMPHARELSAIAGGSALVALWLAVMIYKQRRWASWVAKLGCVVAIASVWFVRHVAWVTEGRYAAKSPYVHAATLVAIVSTIGLAIIAIACVIVSVSAPRGAAAAPQSSP